MKIRIFKPGRKAVAVTLCLLLLVSGLVATGSVWLPSAKTFTASWFAEEAPPPAAAAGDQSEDDHHHAGHSEDASIELSASALRNIGFQPIEIAPGTFVKTITVPAMVVERPGRSQIQVTAPLTGIVMKIIPVQGAAIEPGAQLFEVRLTHEELVAAQSNLIRTAESLEVVNREINRLQSLGEGVIPGRRIVEQEYERQKLEAGLRAERQALLLHGLSVDQVDAILRERQLFQVQSVSAPAHGHESDACRDDHLYHVQELPVRVGEQVEAGQVLCVLADHCELYIEGRAFEDDATQLREAVRRGWNVAASLLIGDRTAEVLDGLKLLYLADHVDPQSRALRFYISLPNQIELDQSGPQGNRFLDWRFKPGQRMELRVPVQQWDQRIVLPVEGVVVEGAETYVYRQNGNHFDQVAVHVEYQDQRSVIIANDGTLFPGDIVAAQGAYQMHLALKNRSGGGTDPHAGHNH